MKNIPYIIACLALIFGTYIVVQRLKQPEPERYRGEDIVLSSRGADFYEPTGAEKIRQFIEASPLYSTSSLSSSLASSSSIPDWFGESVTIIRHHSQSSSWSSVSSLSSSSSSVSSSSSAQFTRRRFKDLDCTNSTLPCISSQSSQ